VSTVVAQRALNRALLARQLLLSRDARGPVEAIEQLAGLQAQLPRPPFIGLWSRLANFDRTALLDAIHARTIVRVTAMRGTLTCSQRATTARGAGRCSLPSRAASPR
jgi:hypothetical protein